MRKIKKTSLAFIALPFLFLGCMQEKVSTIVPVKSIDKKVVKNENNNSYLEVTNQTIKLMVNKKNPTISIRPSILDQLALSVQNNIEIEITGDPTLVTKAIEVNEDWIEFTKEDEILETAKEYLGVQYIWAANGPSAFDCSGYTKYVFKKNGITIPRYSGHQANVGTKIAFNELEKGDLVFFDTEKKFTKKVNHVGIYIGENRFIHASSARKKVMISSFSQKKFYKNRFLHGRRIIDSNYNFASYNKKKENKRTN